MSVLVYIDHNNGSIKKSSLEAASYARETAAKIGGTLTALVLGALDAGEIAQLGEYGVAKVLHDSGSHFSQFDTRAFTKAIGAAVDHSGAEVLVLSNDSTGKSLGPRLSVRLKAGLVSSAIALPDTSNGFVVRKGAFSGKAFADYTIKTAKKVISVNPNAFGVLAGNALTADIEAFDSGLSAADFAVEVLEVSRASDSVPLPEAELVVSAGRGLKGPENWGMVEELATLLGAATACSRPVSDVGWRPHHEHVGQTGITISPNLYIAIGISGAIQHLAGVSSSKVIVVINKDPEAPFFKSADYGIVGDAFEVVPKIISAVKELKGV